MTIVNPPPPRNCGQAAKSLGRRKPDEYAHANARGQRGETGQESRQCRKQSCRYFFFCRPFQSSQSLCISETTDQLGCTASDVGRHLLAERDYDLAVGAFADDIPMGGTQLSGSVVELDYGGPVGCVSD